MNLKAGIGIIIGLVFLGLVLVAALPEGLVVPASGPTQTGVGEAMWGTQARAFETVVQSLIILGGVVGILLLLGSRRSREVSP